MLGLVPRRTFRLVGIRSARGALLKVAIGAAVAACHLGCGASTYSRLRPECECAEHAPLARACADRGLETHLLMTTAGGGPSVRLAVHECAPPGPAQAPRRTIVFIHGIFSDHECWRYVAGDLGLDSRLLLVDLPGCGDSDKPEPAPKVEAALYGPDAMSRRVLEAVSQRLTAESGDGGGPVMLVGHSLGGMMTIRMFSDPALRRDFAPVLDRVDRVVLIAPIDVSVEKADPLFLKIASLSGVEVGLGSTFGIVEESVAKGIVQSVGHESLAMKEEADKRCEILCNAPTRHAMQAMLRTLIPRIESEDKFKPDWPAIDRLVAQYKDVDARCLILWGAWDENLPVSMGYKLQAQLARSELRIFPTSKHSPHIEQPAACIALIRDFLRSDTTIAGAPHTNPAVVVNVAPFGGTSQARKVESTASPQGRN